MHVPSYTLSASSSESHAQMSRWLVGSSRMSRFAPFDGELGERGPRPLAAAERLDGVFDDLALKPEAAEQVAHLLFGLLRVVVRPHRPHHALLRIEDREVLVEVAGEDEVAALHEAARRFLFAQEDAEQRRLAAAVRRP